MSNGLFLSHLSASVASPDGLAQSLPSLSLYAFTQTTFFFFFVVELSIRSHIVVWLQQLLVSHDMKSSNCTQDCFIPFDSTSLMGSFARD